MKKLFSLLKKYISIASPMDIGKNKKARLEKDLFKEVASYWLRGIEDFKIVGGKIVKAYSFARRNVKVDLISFGDYIVYRPDTYCKIPKNIREQIVFCTLEGSYSGYHKYLFVHKDFLKMSNGKRTGEYSWNSNSKQDFYSVIDVAIGSNGAFINFKSNHGYFKKEWVKDFSYKDNDRMISLYELRKYFGIDIVVETTSDSSFFSFLEDNEEMELIARTNQAIGTYLHGDDYQDASTFDGFFHSVNKVILYYLPGEKNFITEFKKSLEKAGITTILKYWYIDKIKDPKKYYEVVVKLYTFRESLLEVLLYRKRKKANRYANFVYHTIIFAADNGWKVLQKYKNNKPKGLGNLEDLKNYLSKIYNKHFKKDEGLVFVPETNKMFKVIKESEFDKKLGHGFYFFRDNNLKWIKPLRSVNHAEGVVGITEPLTEFKIKVSKEKEIINRNMLDSLITGLSSNVVTYLPEWYFDDYNCCDYSNVEEREDDLPF